MQYTLTKLPINTPSTHPLTHPYQPISSHILSPPPLTLSLNNQSHHPPSHTLSHPPLTHSPSPPPPLNPGGAGLSLRNDIGANEDR